MGRVTLITVRKHSSMMRTDRCSGRRGGLRPGGSPSRESLSRRSLSRGISVQVGRCPGASLSGGSWGRLRLGGLRPEGKPLPFREQND